MPLLRPDTPDDPRLARFRDIGDAELRRREGVFLAEGRLVVRRLLTETSYRTRELLLTDAAYAALEDVVTPRLADLAVHVVPRDWMEGVTGFNLHRGCLAIGERGPDRDWREVAGAPRRLLVLEGVGNPDNVGGLFRTARAFGVGGVLLGPGSGDPLYRKAIRVSCGAALAVPFAEARPLPPVLDALKAGGVAVWALTPAPDATPIAEACADGIPPRLALLVGAEGEGLSVGVQTHASRRVRIPIAAAADSLNVNVAAGVALAWAG